MSSSFEKHQKRRLISSYFSVILSIGMVLFLLGTLGFILLNARTLANNFKEKVVLTIYLEDSAKNVEIKQLQNSLSYANYTNSIKYVSKANAANIMTAEYGEDFLEDIGYNPLKNSIDVTLKAAYVSAKRLDSIAEINSKKDFVEEVRYDKDLVGLMNKNVKRISFWILIICAVFTIIAVLLINSTIRLAVFSKRFTIKTMQMVGATKAFIRKPFIMRGLRLGLLGVLLSFIGLSVIIYYTNMALPELKLYENRYEIGLVYLLVLLMGILITMLSSFLATQRYLNLKTDKLYS